jgi:hypothetical protein
MRPALMDNPACGFHHADRIVQIGGPEQLEPEVGHPRRVPDRARVCWVAVEGDQVPAAWRPEEDEFSVDAEALLRSEHLLIEAQGPVEVADCEMDVA